ncbi:MAG TPA: TolC family protein [Gammaproteobacteria bacterium]|nr:TolC family protein [Gammaproteobacteria bacterium]
MRGLQPLTTGLTLGIALLALSGCVSFEPQPILPAASAAKLDQRSLDEPGLRAFVASTIGNVSGGETGPAWSLDTLTLAAFYFQPELDVARTQWAVAEAARVTAGARPGLSVSVIPTRNTTTATPSPRLVTSAVDVTLETAGKRGYRIARATQLAEAARLNLASAAWRVRSRVRSSLVGLYGAIESAKLLRQQQSIHAENLQILEGQYRAGAISAFELTQARLNADAARLALRDAERREAEARVSLATAIGIPAARLEGASLSFDRFDELPAEPDLAEARQQALGNRMDILSALAEYAASQSNLQFAIAGQYPDIHLGPGYEYDQGDNKWSLGLAVSLPPDRNRGPIAEARARRDEAAARFDALQASVLGQIDLAVAAFRSAARKQADASAMLANLTRQESVARAMLQAGAISGSELAALRLQLGASALARLDALQQAQQAVGQLEDAVQRPLGLPSSVWEVSPRSRETTEGTDRP